MELTKEEAVRRYRKQWDWYAWNPGKNKNEYPEFKETGIPFKRCYLCEFTGMNCKNCLVEWPKTHEVIISFQQYIPCVASYFGEWVNAKTPEERSRLAALIRDLPEKKEPEPEFKIGDWVEVVNPDYSFTGFVAFFKENDLEQFAEKFAKRSTVYGEKYQIVAIGKHSSQYDYYGPIYVLEKDDKIYLMNHKDSRSPEKLAFKLTEPPKPKFAIGDKVVPVSKTAPGWQNGIENNILWQKSKERGYFFVSGIDKYETERAGKTVYVCSHHGINSSGDFFLESDLRPYVEPAPRKFKVGDIITGNAESDEKYAVTDTSMTKAEVIELREDGVIKIKILDHKRPSCVGTILCVEEKYFDLVVEPLKEIKPKPKAFKVGDRVRVKADLEVGKPYNEGCIFTLPMSEYCGKPAIISSAIKPNWGNRYCIDIDGGCWSYSDYMLELLPPINHCPENKTVEGTTADNLPLKYIFNGNKTICILVHHGKKHKGIAKCAPSDKWNGEQGKAIAYARARIALWKDREQSLIK